MEHIHDIWRREADEEWQREQDLQAELERQQSEHMYELYLESRREEFEAEMNNYVDMLNGIFKQLGYEERNV